MNAPQLAPSQKQHPNVAHPMFDPVHGNPTNRAKPWQPFGSVGLLSAKITSETATEARKLYEAWQKARAEVGRVKDAQRDATKAAEAAKAKAADGSTVVADAKRLKISEGEVIRRRNAEAVELTEAAGGFQWRGAMGPGITAKSGIIGEAENAVEGTKSDYEAFLTRHADELARELQADRERVHKAISALLKHLEPLKAEHDEITQTLTQLYGRTEGINPEDIPTGKYEQKPALVVEHEVRKSENDSRTGYVSLTGGNGNGR